jgi:hypothetical protein
MDVKPSLVDAPFAYDDSPFAGYDGVPGTTFRWGQSGQPCSLFILMFLPPTDHMSVGDTALSSVRLELEESYLMAPSLPPSSASESMEGFDNAASDQFAGQTLNFEDVIQLPSSPPSTQSAGM